MSASPPIVKRSQPPAKPAARPPARPVPKLSPKPARDPERTRARILEAARAEFAAHGLGGARVDRIAVAADANKRMLYYYFGNKDDLFLAVLEGAYEHIREAEKALRLTEVDPPEAIRRLVAFTWEYYLEHPEFMTLLNSANLHKARHLEKSTKVRSMHSPFVAMIEEILERGRKSGVFRAGVDPVQLYVSIASLTYFYLGNKYTLSAIFGRDLLSPRARAERLAHMTDLVLGYLFKT
jgi:AcrR family transcriptional regulator